MNLERIIRVSLTRAAIIKVLNRLRNNVNWSSYEWLVLLGKALKVSASSSRRLCKMVSYFSHVLWFLRSCFVASILLLWFADWANLDLSDCVCICMVLCFWDDLATLGLRLGFVTVRVSTCLFDYYMTPLMIWF